MRVMKRMLMNERKGVSGIITSPDIVHSPRKSNPPVSFEATINFDLLLDFSFSPQIILYYIRS